ncbi:hypothetical protein ACGFNP_40485 [Nonomuraea sp. NPDC049269]|uniref:hypothetical protein n=1 Tax=Nonomuraea sp. NPDC049269 TaxID=3364349 RepID=UPI00371A08DE
MQAILVFQLIEDGRSQDEKGSVIDAVRKELRRQTSHNADANEIDQILREEVLRAGALA